MNKVQRIESTVFNGDTGEILGNTIIEKDIKENRKYVVFKNNHSFAKTFTYEIPEFSNKMYLAYFFELIHRLEKYTNIIVVKRNGSICSASRSDIKSILDISESTFSRFISEARKSGAMATINVSGIFGYCINPAYAYNGAGIDPMLFRIFENDERFILSLNSQSIADFKEKTGNDYMQVIKEKHPVIYKLKFK